MSPLFVLSLATFNPRSTLVAFRTQVSKKKLEPVDGMQFVEENVGGVENGDIGVGDSL